MRARSCTGDPLRVSRTFGPASTAVRVGFFSGAVPAMILDRFAALGDGVGIGSFVTQEAAEGTLLQVGPLSRVGIGGVEFRFDFGVGEGGTLQEPIGLDEFGDEMTLGL